MPKGITRRLYIITFILLILSILNTGMFLRYLLLTRGEAAMINRLGVVRGQIQRIVKLRLSSAVNEERISEGIETVDTTLVRFRNLRSDRFNLVEEGFDPLLEEIEAIWAELRGLLARAGGDEQRILELSEEAWRVADTSVIYLQKRSERERSFLYLALASLGALVIAVVGAMISIRKMIDNRIEYHATYDELTGAFNRTTLVERINAFLELSQRYRRPFSVIMIDIDHFKAVNDELGHRMGDKVLRHLSQRLSYYLRGADVLFRYGGEEFLVLLPETGLAAAEMTAEKLRWEVEERTFLDELRCTISCGVASWRNGDDDASLLDRADNALYSAKREGRNRVVTESEASDSARS
jgi:diguanylate cyclase (GGDEF)-like protein